MAISRITDIEITEMEPSTSKSKWSVKKSFTFDVKGYFYYNEEINQYSSKPIVNAKVILWDDELWGREQIGKEQYTDSDGYFCFSNVNNNDGFLEGGRDLYVTIYMENEIVFVTHGPGDNEIGVWHWNTAKVPNVSEDDIENGYLRNLYHHWYPPGFNDNTEGYTMCCGSARILFEIGIAYDFLENNCSDNNEDLDEDGYTRDRWNQPKIEARWPSTGGDSFFDNYYVEYGYEYDPKDGYERDAFKRDVVLHEYSHAVMWKLYGNHWPNGGPYILKHWLTLDTNPHTALVEGWAEYLPNVIQKDDNHRGNNVETENFYATRYDQNKSWNGNSIEGAVLNILYDLSDDSSYNDLYPWSDDDEIHNFDEVWRIMRDYNPDALVDYSYYTNDFWDQWNSGHQQELWEIFYNHGINKDSQPPSISNIYHLPDSPTSSQDVDVYANVMDNLSGIKDVTCFYKVNESEYHELEMSIAEYATLGGYQFTAQIPVQGPGSEVKYHIEAEDNAGQHYRTFTFQYTVQEENSQPQLNVYPTSHNFGTMNEGETATWTFYIENTGGGELTWEIKEDLSWISVNRSDGTTTEIDSITVTANTTGLTPGDYSGYIYVISDGEEAQIYVEVTVSEEVSEEPPQIYVHPTSHNFGTMNEGETATWTFYIENTGGGELTWEIKEDLSWISVNRSDGITTEIDSITVTANTTGLTPGDYSGYIYVISDGEEAQIYVEVTVSEEASEEPPQIYVHPTSHNFGTMNEGETATWTFYIENTGGGELKWLMVNSLPWLTVTPLQGTTTTEIDSVTVTVNTTGLNCGTHYEGAMAIMTNGSGTPRLSIEVTIADCSNPQIYVDPTSHNFGTMNEGETATWTFYIENTGEGTLIWEINIDGGLSMIITFNPRNGTTTTETDRVTVTVNTTGLNPGHYSGNIYISSDGGRANVYVEVTVSEEASEEPPQIYVDPTSHNFGTMNEGETATWTFYIENTGGGELKWLMVNSLPWLTVTPQLGTTTSEIDSVTVTVNTTGLNCGTHYEGNMAIMTNGSGTPRLYIEVTIAECSNPQIYVDPTSHNFGTMNEGETATCTFYIENSEGEPTCPVVTSLPRLTVARKVELLPQRLILSPFTLLDSGRVLQWKHLHNTPKS